MYLFYIYIYIFSICSKIVYLAKYLYNSSFFFHQPLFLTIIPNHSNYSVIDHFVLLEIRERTQVNELKS